MDCSDIFPADFPQRTAPDGDPMEFRLSGSHLNGEPQDPSGADRTSRRFSVLFSLFFFGTDRNVQRLSNIISYNIVYIYTCLYEMLALED